jgi:hypothetical protein
MAWGLAPITGRTRYAVFLVPVLFMLHPVWVLYRIAAYGVGEWCRPHQDTCVAISQANDPELIQAQVIANVISLLVSVALIGVLFYVIRRADRNRITENAYSSQMRLVILAITVFIFVLHAFRH